MRNITINHTERTIVITKAFDKKASVYGSPEYLMLKDAQKDHPGYTVEVKATKSKREAYKGLTYEYMERYIAAKDKTGEILDEYLMLTGKSKEAKELLVEPASYFEVKNWFFLKFPEIEEFHQKRENALTKIKEDVDAKRAKKIEEAEKAEAERYAKLKVVA